MPIMLSPLSLVAGKFTLISKMKNCIGNAVRKFKIVRVQETV